MTAALDSEAGARPAGSSGLARLWRDYWSSLKPRAVEEPIDVWLHRPLGFLIARALLPTPVSPNAVTVASIVFGLCAGGLVFTSLPGRLPIAGVMLFLATVLDCADGQLARLRRTSSAFGRMLDGVGDFVVSIAVASAGAWLLILKFTQPTWLLCCAVLLASLTIVTSSFHTAMYDHYKNVFLRLTHPSYRDGEDYTVALARYRADTAGRNWLWRIVWAPYLFYVKSQGDYLHRFDPNTAPELGRLPAFSEQRGRIYRAHAEPLMRLWRGFFGFGSLMFGLTVSIGLDLTDYYLVFRLLFLNGLFYAYMRPAQRRASAAAFSEIARLESVAPEPDLAAPGAAVESA